jgi:hypothetical protein
MRTSLCMDPFWQRLQQTCGRAKAEGDFATHRTWDVKGATAPAPKMDEVVCAHNFFRRKGTKPILQVTVVLDRTSSLSTVATESTHLLIVVRCCRYGRSRKLWWVWESFVPQVGHHARCHACNFLTRAAKPYFPYSPLPEVPRFLDSPRFPDVLHFPDNTS